MCCCVALCLHSLFTLWAVVSRAPVGAGAASLHGRWPSLVLFQSRFQSRFPAFSSFSFLVHSYNLLRIPNVLCQGTYKQDTKQHINTSTNLYHTIDYKRPTNLFIEKSELVVHLIRVCVCRISQQHAGGAGRSLPQDAERPSNHAAPFLSPPSVPPRQAFDHPQAHSLSLSLSPSLTHSHHTKANATHTR